MERAADEESTEKSSESKIGVYASYSRRVEYKWLGLVRGGHVIGCLDRVFAVCCGIGQRKMIKDGGYDEHTEAKATTSKAVGRRRVNKRFPRLSVSTTSSHFSLGWTRLGA